MRPFPLVFAAIAVAFLVYRRRRLEGESKVVLVVLAAGLVVYGTGLVHIPNVEKLLVDIGTRLGHWTYLLVGAMAFAETGAFLGFVAPRAKAPRLAIVTTRSKLCQKRKPIITNVVDHAPAATMS